MLKKSFELSKIKRLIIREKSRREIKYKKNKNNYPVNLEITRNYEIKFDKKQIFLL